jgi:hypothetical protein
MSKKHHISTGGQRIKWKRSEEITIKVRFVSAISGEEVGVAICRGREIIGRDRVDFRFDGLRGCAIKGDKGWEAKVWDDEDNFRRFPDMANWFFRNFGG